MQLYVSHPRSKVEFPREALKGFQRVSLQPGETKTVRIPLRASDLAYRNGKLAAMTVEAESLGLMIGSSSKEIKLTSTIRVR